mmetsp:Transcript_13112/g.36908  ORF Transcript_13112/g.36908 Transcript_13112/m.36908 type:complete len:241 (-) Transcript_13112:1840-2562(-)
MGSLRDIQGQVLSGREELGETQGHLVLFDSGGVQLPEEHRHCLTVLVLPVKGHRHSLLDEEVHEARLLQLVQAVPDLVDVVAVEVLAQHHASLVLEGRHVLRADAVGGFAAGGRHLLEAVVQPAVLAPLRHHLGQRLPCVGVVQLRVVQRVQHTDKAFAHLCLVDIPRRCKLGEQVKHRLLVGHVLHAEVDGLLHELVVIEGDAQADQALASLAHVFRLLELNEEVLHAGLCLVQHQARS